MKSVSNVFNHMQLVEYCSLVALLLLLFSCSKKRDLPMLLAVDSDSIVNVNSKVMLQSQPTLFATNFTGDTVAEGLAEFKRQ